MSKQTSFSHQLKVLEAFSVTLQEFQQALYHLSDKYEKSIYSLYEEDGLMEEIYHGYDNNLLHSMKESLMQLAKRVEEQDIPYVEKEISFMAARL